ncbi:hypothetical protein ACFWHW_08765 [Streptomyces pharetrae]|uniref:hypothetical protein n=1 Tax=Streptomyces pharetrae TaxID=291370 RepID=UPI003655D4B8
MDDDEIRSRFDGRGEVGLLLGGVTAARRRRIDDIGHALGYRLLDAQNLGYGRVRLRYRRDDAPHARRRAEQTIARLRAGGPVLTEIEPAPPPPPSAPPPAPAGHRPQGPRRPPSHEPPPPPPVAAPPRPRVPPLPPYPPAPGAPPAPRGG